MNFWITILFPILNFLILMVLLWAMARKPIRIFLAGRAEAFKKRLKDSRARLLRAEAHLQESEARSILYDRQEHELMRSMLEYGRRESNDLLQEGQERVDIMRLDVRRQVAHELARLRNEMYRETVVASIDRAEKDIRESLTDEEAARLAERSIGAIVEGIKS